MKCIPLPFPGVSPPSPSPRPLLSFPSSPLGPRAGLTLLGSLPQACGSAFFPVAAPPPGSLPTCTPEAGMAGPPGSWGQADRAQELMPDTWLFCPRSRPSALVHSAEQTIQAWRERPRRGPRKHMETSIIRKTTHGLQPFAAPKYTSISVSTCLAEYPCGPMPCVRRVNVQNQVKSLPLGFIPSGSWQVYSSPTGRIPPSCCLARDHPPQDSSPTSCSPLWLELAPLSP